MFRLSTSGTRFKGGVIAAIHARSDPPVKNIDRCIAISVVSMPTACTDKDRLALTASTVNAPAGGAGLRRKPRIDFDEVRLV